MRKFYLVFIVFYALSINVFAGFVTIQGDKFKLDGNDFYPMVVNYLVTLTEDHTTGNFYLSPNWNYSENWGWPNTGGSGRFFYSSTDDIGESLSKLSRDMTAIKSMGFNTLRICGISPTITDGVLSVPTGSYSEYYQLLEQLLDTLDNHGLKAILLVGASFEHHDAYRPYHENISEHFKNNTTILAYDVYNEPFWSFPRTNINDKYLMANWVSDWYYSIKKNAPNQLVTIGATHPETVINGDPGILLVDFISFHLYAWTKDIDKSKNKIAIYLKWISQAVNKPWIISETGYSGTDISTVNHESVGTEVQQKQFADFLLQRALDCDCMGNGWWQFSEIKWQNPWEDYLGLITHYPHEEEKLAASSFRNFSYNKNSSNCIQPSNYYNINNYSNYEVRGYVKDENGNAIGNAVIIGWKWSTGGYYITFSRSNGYFVLYTDGTGSPINDLWISANGYSIYQTNNPSSYTTYNLTQIDKNQWQKKWTNNNNNKIDNWVISSNDKFYNGDFDGDGAEELLCINTANGGLVSLYDFNTGIYKLKWSNSGSSSSGSYIYDFKNNLTVGDFNGDGADELLGVSTYGLRVFKYQNNNWTQLWYQNTSSALWPYQTNFISGDFDGDGKDEVLGNSLPNGWLTMFHFDNNQWSWGWSNYGNNNAILPYRDNLIAGDFDGNGTDEILGNDIDGNGWLTMFHFYNNNWNWGWSNYGTDNGMLPYRNKLLVGNFDNDNKDEILGIASWATKFDFENGKFNWTWSTGNDFKIVDYPINSSDQHIIIKPYKNVPAYLFANHGNSVNMYGMTNLIVNENSLKSGRLNNSSSLSEINNPENDVYPSDISCFPNPADNMITISLSEILIGCEIWIYDSYGRQVKSFKMESNLKNVDISDLTSGMFFVKLQNDQRQITKKFIKK